MIRIRRIRANNFKQLKEVDLFLPPQGRFLVQGKNEAGKSTLFEAVFFSIFGYPLVTETGTRRLDDLICYGVEEAYVELWLVADGLDTHLGSNVDDRRARNSIENVPRALRSHIGENAPGRLLKIRRTIVRGKANDWQLDIVTPNDIEEVRGNRPVNNRIVGELGFDADALLNTAFVEQKKLDKLEGMARSQREQSLMKLLNLERMTDLENEFKLRGDDRLALQRAEQRAELAQVQAELPKKERKLAEIEHQLLFIELKRSLEATLRERSAMAQLSEEIDELSAKRKKLAEEVEQAERIYEGLQTARELYSLYERASDLHKEIERLEQDLAEAAELRDEKLPELTKQREALQLLRDRLSQVDELEETRQSSQAEADRLDGQLTEYKERADKLAKIEERERELRTTISQEQAQLEQADYLANAHRVRGALRDWIAAQETIETPERRAAALAEARNQEAALKRRLRWEILGLGLGIVLAILAGWAVPRLAVGSLAVTAVLLVILIWRVLGAWRALSSVAELIGRLEGQQEAHKAAAERNQAKLEAAAQRLRNLNAVIPSSVERGHQAVAELDQRLSDHSPEALQAQADAARERLARARALHEETTREIEQLEQALNKADIPALQKQLRKVRQQAAQSGAALQNQRERAAQLAEALDLEPDKSRVESRLGALENEIQNVERRSAAAEDQEGTLEGRQQDLNELWNRIEPLFESLSDLEDVELPAWDRNNAADVIRTAGQALRQAYEEAGGDQAKQELQQIQAAIGRKEGERNTRREQADAHLDQARSHMQRLELDDGLPNNPTDGDVESWVERISHLDVENEQVLQGERDELRERIGYLREQRGALESTLGLEGEILDVEQTRAALKAKQRELQVRQKAQEIVELARRRVVEQILPNTMEHMRKVLPVLTMERYYDAELTEDYRIRVWDERAGQGGDWKEKNIFSGGTKDQFSLALRLAFALATLPEERGSAPSFIFLDEPLSSFDNERARALLHLLTEGEIAQSFDQIFLISHVRVNPELFNYHITIDRGRVIESDLPEPDAPTAQSTLQPELASGP